MTYRVVESQTQPGHFWLIRHPPKGRGTRLALYPDKARAEAAKRDWESDDGPTAAYTKQG